MGKIKETLEKMKVKKQVSQPAKPSDEDIDIPEEELSEEDEQDDFDEEEEESEEEIKKEESDKKKITPEQILTDHELRLRQLEFKTGLRVY